MGRRVLLSLVPNAWIGQGPLVSGVSGIPG
jgi:hypothetical protein